MTLDQILSQFAFPVAACICMAWYVYKTQQEARADRNEMQERHKNEVDKLAEVISNNTVAITRLVDRLEKGG